MTTKQQIEETRKNTTNEMWPLGCVPNISFHQDITELTLLKISIFHILRQKEGIE